MKSLLTILLIFGMVGAAPVPPTVFGEQGEESVQVLIESPSAAFQQANALYRQGQYEPAADIYQQILREGGESSALYYNLGNAYFKQGDLGRAILNYRRAWKLDPRDPEINKNLEYAQESLRDDISALPLSLFTRFRRTLVRQLPLAVWLKISSAFYFLTALWILLVLLVKPFKRISPPVLKTLGLFLVLSIIVSVAAYSYYRSPRAIILEPSVSVRWGPKKEDVVHFELHEGTEVRVVRQKEKWCQIALPDGKSGWLLAQSLEII